METDRGEFAYEDGEWLEHEADSDWPYWRVTRRLADVDDGERFYQLSWHHPRTREYREEYVPAGDAVADFAVVDEDTVWAAAGQAPPGGAGANRDRDGPASRGGPDADTGGGHGDRSGEDGPPDDSGTGPRDPG